MPLTAAERGEEKENACPTLSIIAKVEGEFHARGYEVSLSKATVNCYVQNDMICVAIVRSKKVKGAHHCLIETDRQTKKEKGGGGGGHLRSQ